jgi:hypothetical protein
MFEALQGVRCRLLGLSRKELQQEAKAVGVPANLKSADIVEHLMEASQSSENRPDAKVRALTCQICHPDSLTMTLLPHRSMIFHSHVNKAGSMMAACPLPF